MLTNDEKTVFLNGFVKRVTSMFNMAGNENTLNLLNALVKVYLHERISDDVPELVRAQINTIKPYIGRLQAKPSSIENNFVLLALTKGAIEQVVNGLDTSMVKPECKVEFKTILSQSFNQGLVEADQHDFATRFQQARDACGQMFLNLMHSQESFASPAEDVELTSFDRELILRRLLRNKIDNPLEERFLVGEGRLMSTADANRFPYALKVILSTCSYKLQQKYHIDWEVLDRISRNNFEALFNNARLIQALDDQVISIEDLERFPENSFNLALLLSQPGRSALKNGSISIEEAQTLSWNEFYFKVTVLPRFHQP